MKNAVKVQKQKQAVQRAVEKKPGAAKGPSWAMLVVVVVFTAVVTFVLCEYVLLSRIPAGMLGKWVVVAQDSDPQGVGRTLEFCRDGSVTSRLQGREDSGVARVEGGRVHITVFDQRSLDDTTRSYLLISLTDNQMELESEPVSVDGMVRGGMIRMERSAQ